MFKISNMNQEVNGKTYNYLIKVSGLVQGVGFRPFIYRLANEFNYKGWVDNRNDGVYIAVRSNSEVLEKFKEEIFKKAPIASNIKQITVERSKEEQFIDFRIVKSKNISNKVTEISPDIGVCEDCLRDLEEQKHRIHYPFINCTNCGPRFTIIKALPYDRPLTTMKTFEMCEQCESEYSNVLDRRFHAQPIACNHCGPVYTLHENNQQISNYHEILRSVGAGIDHGKIYAFKSIGGYNFACNALNSSPINNLRKLKLRDRKPFAIMFRSLNSLNIYVHINKEEQNLIQSWRKPIVLLKLKKQFTEGIGDGLSTIGAMLPYMPFHFQLFDHLKTDAIVLTSGNISNEPILISNEKALSSFNEKVDGILTYNREIYNRTDDSVCTINNSKERIIRRSRSYAPSPIHTNLNTEGIMACGAELVNSFALGKGNQIIMSQYIGDLKNFETFNYYKETFGRFKKLFRFTPEIIVSDKHPDYLSSQFAKELQNEFPEAKVVQVQHHHAHIAAVLADQHNNSDVIGISMDGIGLGDDGKIWGAEFFVGNIAKLERKYQFEYIPMPGGDKASKEPWRMAVSYLYQYFGKEFLNFDLPILKAIQRTKVETLIQMIDKKINSPLCSSAGRLFDAISALLGICTYSNYHAEAPMLLEFLIKEKHNDCYNFTIKNKSINFKDLFEQIIFDLKDDKSNSFISEKFHNTIIEIIKTICIKLRNQFGIDKVVFSGGSFQNKYIAENAELELKKLGFELILPDSVPYNDQSIAVGQLAIAAKLRENQLI